MCAQRAIGELNLFRTVMADDVEHLQQLVLKMSTIAPIDITRIRNNRGQTLYDLAADRNKQNCLEYLGRIYSKTDIMGRTTAWQTGADKCSQPRPKRTQSARLSELTPRRPYASFARCVCRLFFVYRVDSCTICSRTTADCKARLIRLAVVVSFASVRLSHAERFCIEIARRRWPCLTTRAAMPYRATWARRCSRKLWALPKRSANY